MKFYDETKPVYMETDASGVGLGATLLQTRSNTSCQRDEAPDNRILRPTAFSTKSITLAKKRCSNIEREALSVLYGLEKFHYLLCNRGNYNHRSQTTHCHFQKRCIYIITEATVNPTKNTSILSENYIQAQTRPIHGRLAVQT